MPSRHLNSWKQSERHVTRILMSCRIGGIMLDVKEEEILDLISIPCGSWKRFSQNLSFMH